MTPFGTHHEERPNADKSITGVAFIGMVVQIPLIFATLPLEKMKGINGKVIGNCIFWVSFSLVGQPLAALLYFFAWVSYVFAVNVSPSVLSWES